MLQQDVGADAEFVMISAEKLFAITKGASLVMNPTSEHPKSFWQMRSMQF
jgi:SseB protein.